MKGCRKFVPNWRVRNLLPALKRGIFVIEFGRCVVQTGCLYLHFMYTYNKVWANKIVLCTTQQKTEDK